MILIVFVVGVIEFGFADSLRSFPAMLLLLGVALLGGFRVGVFGRALEYVRRGARRR